jgi:hypothetical protein
MKTYFFSLVLTYLVLGAGIFGIYWLAAASYDRVFAWVLVVFAFTIGPIAIVECVLSTNKRLDELERKVHRLQQKRTDGTESNDE